MMINRLMLITRVKYFVGRLDINLYLLLFVYKLMLAFVLALVMTFVFND